MARDASTAVLFRRGPSRWTRLYLWDTRTDHITPGSWFHGRLYEWLSDLSPDGRHLLYMAHNESRRRVQAAAQRFPGREMWTWTALCRPPQVRALGLWDASDGTSGGGVFTSNHALHLNHPGLEPEALQEPVGFTVRGTQGREQVDVFLTTLNRTGWRLKAWPERWRGMGEAHPIIFQKRALELQLICSSTFKRSVRYLWHGAGPIPLLESATWAEYDQQRRLVLAAQGCLYELRGTALHLLMDFNPDQPPRKPRTVPAAEAPSSASDQV
ncbi:hypothetical protein C8263_12535 [Deinococcus arcticus]|uniref:Uncharacterized protein n=2 Tax=Deinococcus arcticus TaxID=2136176 RepID=A0A2T3W677_9DEIO|nr:hypothetical protein C8263_12535 [Deinococcus arcticus]